jgi:hypothetical protein
MMIVNQSLLKAWWWNCNYGDSFIPRTDWTPGVRGIEHPCFMHSRELCRHFDGYSFRADVFDARDIPPLDIPKGFFENDIKIRYGYDKPCEGWTWLNPLVSEYRVLNVKGTDYKCLPEDLPLFWNGRISQTDEEDGLDHDAMKAQRNLAYYYMACPRRTHEIAVQQMGPHTRDLRPAYPAELRKFWER